MIRSGRATLERKLALTAGTASLEPADRAEILALLSADPDERIAERAGNALLALAPPDFAAALARADTAPQLFEYCAKHLADKPDIAELLIAHPGCPPQALAHAVAHFPADTVHAIADNLDLLSMRPEIAVVLLASPAINAEQRRNLEELGQGAPDEAALIEAVKEAEPDFGKRQSLLVRLSRMRVVERVQLAIKGGREERLALIRDPCRVVQRAVLQSARLTEREVESFAAMANLGEEVLRGIAGNRKFRRNYAVLKNLANNPKTPLDVSLHFVQHLHTPDLRTLGMNKNVPETLRTVAVKTFRQRKATNPGG
ncbi:MAG: hypothetical protein WAM91_09805 [Candidatus Acidiferrales bacterium]